jgi:activator of 2-hydroxyglutaryl-CoA dehydratase
LPETDVAIELGGEDAKILFLTGGLEVRMNGSCAGGTGAFIDQMATLLEITPDDLNRQPFVQTRFTPSLRDAGFLPNQTFSPC